MTRRHGNADVSRAVSRPKTAHPYQDTTEAHTAALCDHLAAELGWRVERYEQRRATRIHEGLPDRRYVAANGFRVWAELKRPGGKMTAQQHAWIVAELNAGGLALPVDDPAVLRRLYQTWGKLYGHNDAVAYCRTVTELTAQRGYRRAA